MPFKRTNKRYYDDHMGQLPFFLSAFLVACIRLPSIVSVEFRQASIASRSFPAWQPHMFYTFAIYHSPHQHQRTAATHVSRTKIVRRFRCRRTRHGLANQIFPLFDMIQLGIVQFAKWQ